MNRLEQVKKKVMTFTSPMMVSTGKMEINQLDHVVSNNLINNKVNNVVNNELKFDSNSF